MFSPEATSSGQPQLKKSEVVGRKTLAGCEEKVFLRKYTHNLLPHLKDAQIQLKDAQQTAGGCSLFTYCVDLVRKQPATCWEPSQLTKILGKRFAN